MRYGFTLPAIAIAVATLCGAAQAATPWASTLTSRHDVGTATEGLAMQPGESMHIAVSLQMRNKGQLDAQTAALMAGRQVPHLTSAQFLERHAPTVAQADAVAAHLRAAGFVNVTIAPNRLLVSADGTAATAKAAFNVEMKHFSIDGRTAYANVSDAQVPAHLAGLVLAVHGLQNVHQHHTMHRIATSTPESVTASAAVGHNPTEFSAIYNASGLPPATNSTIAIISEGDITQTLTDLSTFVAGAGYPAPAVTKVVVGAAGTDTAGIVEWNMDSQSSLSAAGGQVKGMIFYVSTTLDDAPLTEAYNQAVSDNLAQSINVSLGECETAAKNSGIMAADDAIFQVAVAQGQMFSVSSGDSGSYQCGSAKGGQSYPAVSPYVMAIGGTKVKTTNQTTWAGETVWACTSSLTCQLLGGAGGGASINEPAPAWQVSSGVLKGATLRGIPDISFDADPSSGALVLVGTKTQQVGGTSLAAPLWAGFWARIQSQHANALIFPGNALYGYGVANSAKMFHDVTSGKNGGYSAAAGWDYASGFGSVNIGKFAAFVNTHPGF
jgi:pseudomonalisin/xanthomonalisin